MANDISRVNIIENVGRKLQVQFGDNPIPVNEIVKEAREVLIYSSGAVPCGGPT